jgi:acyl-CoA dehydrogenase
MGLADGPTEVHTTVLARQLLASATPSPDSFPTGHLIRREEDARAAYAEVLERLA